MILKKIWFTTISLIICLLVSITPVYSYPGDEENYNVEVFGGEENSNTESLPSFEFDDTTEQAFSRLDPVTNFFVTLCKALFSLAAIAIVVVCLTCRNDRNFEMYLKILGTVCITTFIAILIGNNTINKIIAGMLESLGF